MVLDEQSLCAQGGTIYSRPVARSATSATRVLTSRGRADADHLRAEQLHEEPFTTAPLRSN